MTKPFDDKTTTIPTNNKTNPAQNQSTVTKDELSDAELDKAAGGFVWIPPRIVPVR